MHIGQDVLSAARLGGFVGVLAASATALAASWVYWYGVPIDPRFAVGTALFAGLILAGDAFSVRVDPRSTIGVSDVGLLLAIAVLGPAWAALATLPADLLAGRRSRLRMAYETSHSVAIVFLAGTVFRWGPSPCC